jgi:hypothetical protein
MICTQIVSRGSLARKVRLMNGSTSVHSIARHSAISHDILPDRSQERTKRRREHIAEPNKRDVEADLRLKRLYDTIEFGVADLGDPGLKECIAGLKRSGPDQRRARQGGARKRGSATHHHNGAT